MLQKYTFFLSKQIKQDKKYDFQAKERVSPQRMLQIALKMFGHLS